MTNNPLTNRERILSVVWGLVAVAFVCAVAAIGIYAFEDMWQILGAIE